MLEGNIWANCMFLTSFFMNIMDGDKYRGFRLPPILIFLRQELWHASRLSAVNEKVFPLFIFFWV